MCVVERVSFEWCSAYSGGMKASPQNQQLLYDLQTLDIDARKIRNEAEELEETKHLQSIVAQRKAIVIERHKLAQKVKEASGHNDEIQASIDKLQTQVGAIDLKLKASGVTPKEVIALTKQQDSLKAQISDLEDSQMEQLNQIDALNRDNTILEQNDAKLHSAGLDMKNRRDDKIASLKKRMASVASRRKIALGSLPQDLLDLYENMSKEAQGNVVVQFINGHVEGAHVELSVAQIHAIEDADPDEVVAFEDDDLIVVRPSAVQPRPASAL